jgi:ferredoxin-nitrite reductase
LKAHIEQEYGKPFEPSGTLLLQMRPFEMYERLKEGSYAFCYQTDFARLDADEMKKIAAYAHEQDAEIRIGIDQNLYLLGLKDKTVPFASPKQSATVLACAGNLCPYSFWSIKNETQYLPLEKISEHRIQVGFSGCAKGCGRHRHTDIGLIGLKTNHFGAAEGGARVYIGAEHSNGRSVGRMLFSMVPLVHLHELLSLVIALYEQSGYGSFEAFSAEILNGYSENFLALWCLANLQTAQTLSLSSNKHTVHSDESHAYEMALLKEHFAALALYKLAEENITHAISVVSKELWTVEGTSDNELFAHASKKNELSSTYLK